MGYFSAIFPELEGQEQPVLPPSQYYKPSKPKDVPQDPAGTGKSGAGAVMPPSQGYTPNAMTQEAAKQAIESAGAAIQQAAQMSPFPAALDVTEKAIKTIDRATKIGTSLEEKPTPKLEANRQAFQRYESPEEREDREAMEKTPVAPAAIEPDPIKKSFKELGIGSEQLIESVGLFAAKMGLTPHDVGAPIVNTAVALRRVLGAMDPQGKFQSALAYELSLARREKMSDRATDPEMDPAEQAYQEEAKRQEEHLSDIRIRRNDKELIYRDTFRKLQETPLMRTWYGMIAYVFLALVTNSPRFAANVLGQADQNALAGELKRMGMDIDRLDRREESAMQGASRARIMAAQRRSQIQDRSSAENLAFRKMFLNHQLIKERAKSINPDDAARKQEDSIIKKLKMAHDLATTHFTKAQQEYENATSIYNTSRPDQQTVAALKAKMDQMRGLMEQYAEDLQKFVPQVGEGIDE